MDKMDLFFKIINSIFTACVVILSCVGIYLAWRTYLLDTRYKLKVEMFRMPQTLIHNQKNNIDNVWIMVNIMNLGNRTIFLPLWFKTDTESFPMMNHNKEGYFFIKGGEHKSIPVELNKIRLEAVKSTKNVWLTDNSLSYKFYLSKQNLKELKKQIKKNQL